MKNLTGIVIAILVIFGGGYGIFVGINKIATPEPIDGRDVGGGVSQGQRYYLTAGTGVSTNAGEISATTTKVYLQTTSTASSTISGVFERGDQIDLKMRAIASSSALASLAIKVYGSDNQLGDWYPVMATSSSISSSVINGEVALVLPLATSSINTCGTNEICREITLSGFYSKYFRVVIDVIGSNAAVWGYAVPRESTPN